MFTNPKIISKRKKIEKSFIFTNYEQKKIVKVKYYFIISWIKSMNYDLNQILTI